LPSLKKETDMPKEPPKPYRTMTPWLGYTPREKKREKPLSRCPSGTCRRAKKCHRAIDGLYCRRTHFSTNEVRAMANTGANPTRRAATPILIRTLPANASLEQAEAYRMMTDMALASAEAAQARMMAKWKQGAFDHLYGPYDPKGAVMRPPPREYVE
jgi:hypothetical protein